MSSHASAAVSAYQNGSLSSISMLPPPTQRSTSNTRLQSGSPIRITGIGREIVPVLLCAILYGRSAGFDLFTVAVALQAAQVKIEERNLLQTVPEYAAYRENSGFLSPPLRKTG